MPPLMLRTLEDAIRQRLARSMPVPAASLFHAMMLPAMLKIAHAAYRRRQCRISARRSAFCPHFLSLFI